ncbi:MAG: hypothetical protein R3A80_05890 [Bdellovibrionota bacterium]
MKNHLRIIKERTQSIPTEADLRGLGNEKVFKHFYPKAVLSENNRQAPTSAFKHDCETLGIHAEVAHNGLHTHYTCESKTLSHKEQALCLFLLALKHSKEFSGKAAPRFHLWEAPIFRHLLKNALDGHPEKEIPTMDEFWTAMNFKHDHYMHLDASTSLHLKQAEVDFNFRSENETHLSLEDCKQIYTNEIQKLVTQHQEEKKHMQKVGAK